MSRRGSRGSRVTPKGPTESYRRRPAWVRAAVWITLFGLAALVVIDIFQNVR